MKITICICLLMMAHLATAKNPVEIEGGSLKEAIAQGLLLPKEKAARRAQSVVIKNNMYCDADYVFSEGSEIMLESGVQLVVQSGKTLQLKGAWLHGRAALWHGIRVEPEGALFVSDSRIEDAYHAVEALSTATVGAKILIDYSIFFRNFIGIYTAPLAQPNVSTITMKKTIFDGGQNIMPSPWISPTLNNKGYAGIEANDFLFLIVRDNNIFRNLINGVIARNTDLTVSLAKFIDIQPEAFYNNTNLPNGNGIYMFADKEKVFHKLVLRGFGNKETDAASFERCYNGVFSTRCGVDVAAARMVQVGHWGLCSQLTHAAQVVQVFGNRIDVPNYGAGVGINLLQNAAKISVHDNIIDVGRITTGNLGQAAGGIQVTDQGILHTTLIQNNSIKLQRADFGISVQSLSGSQASVLGNSIDFRMATNGGNPQPSNGNAIPRNGILVSNCQGINVSCNQITSQHPLTGNANNPPSVNIFANAVGINIDGSKVQVSCNSMFRTGTGMRFNGICGGTVVRANSFRLHTIGLKYEAGATVNQQFDQGNLWYGNFPTINGGAAAVNYSTLVTTNNFTAPTTTNTNGGRYTPPTIISVINNWFSPSTGTQQNCNNSPCPTLTPLFMLATINNTDVATVNNQIPQNPAALPWGLRKGLYDKLDKNPILRLNPAMGQFYNTYQTQPIAAIVAATDAQENTLVVDTMLMLQSQQNKDLTDNLSDSLAVLDSLYFAGVVNPQNWQNQRSAYLQQYAQVVQNQQIVTANVLAQIATQNQQAQGVNTTILPSNTPEQNEYAVNEIYLQTVGNNSNYFSPSQKQTLYDIAHQCPELGGNAVHRARSLYSLIDYELYNTDCASLPQTRTASLDTCHEDVNFPNPSLEGTIGFNQCPNLWTICEPTPDIFPCCVGQISASDSFTYVGQGATSAPLNVESFGAQLEDSLIKGERYKFSFDFAKNHAVGNTPGAMSIWLSNSLCVKEQLIHFGTTNDTSWNTRFVEFVPHENYMYLIISAELYSTTENRMLIDNLRPVPCDTVVPDTFHAEAYHEQTEYLSGLEEEIVISDFNIYPNPNTQGQLTVEWATAAPFLNPSPNGGKDFLIVIVDALGRQVAAYGVAAGATMQVIDIQQLASGVYTVLLQAPLSKSLPKGERLTISRGKLVVLRE